MLPATNPGLFIGPRFQRSSDSSSYSSAAGRSGHHVDFCRHFRKTRAFRVITFSTSQAAAQPPGLVPRFRYVLAPVWSCLRYCRGSSLQRVAMAIGASEAQGDAPRLGSCWGAPWCLEFLEFTEFTVKNCQKGVLLSAFACFCESLESCCFLLTFALTCSRFISPQPSGWRASWTHYGTSLTVPTVKIPWRLDQKMLFRLNPGKTFPALNCSLVVNLLPTVWTIVSSCSVRFMRGNGRVVHRCSHLDTWEPGAIPWLFSRDADPAPHRRTRQPLPSWDSCRVWWIFCSSCGQNCSRRGEVHVAMQQKIPLLIQWSTNVPNDSTIWTIPGSNSCQMLSGKAAEGRPRELLPGVARTVRHVSFGRPSILISMDFRPALVAFFFERMKKGL